MAGLPVGRTLIGATLLQRSFPAVPQQGGSPMAAVDYFLKIDGIDGESQDSKHKGEIELDAWGWKETNAGSFPAGGGGGAGKVAVQDFHFVMKHNTASPRLMLACATGEHLKKAVLVCRKAGHQQQEFLKVTLTDCLVSSYEMGGGAGDVLPVDQFSLNFARIEQEYKQQKADGTLGGAVKSGYDVKQNTKV
jgi:type VI secretion system secreted protein Hcp